ncbi:hypothetical protein Leryth_003939 [Lithospermum erythrorhizon]|nr:hypothetical protein Leryth_003939 [Lithospermum erythrorhizon]
MDGLVKGLLDVALGGNNNRNETKSHRDQLSTSSWAEVVSGEQDDDDPSKNNQNYAYQREEPRQSGGSRPTMRPHKDVNEDYGRIQDNVQNDYEQSRWNQKEEEVGNSDGWETVKKKPSKQHKKVHLDQWDNFKRPPQEQQYSNEVEYGVDMEPSGPELQDLSKACNKLWELDLSRLQPGKDYEIDCAKGKKVHQRDDVAEGTLFSWVSEDVFRKPTFSRFCSLLDNYNPDQGVKEVVTPQERQEQEAFMEEISRTAPIKYLHKYLAAKGIVSESYNEFKRMMTSLWFDLLGRGGTSGCSSAFEHVFVGEIKKQGEVSGFHNWLQFYLEEAKGRVDYQGYIFPRRRGEIPDSETQLLTIQFEWNGVLKSVSSTLVGASPEFEIAIYTLCFFVGGEDNYVELGPYQVNIKCYHFGNKIGSAFPIAE